MSRVKSFDRFMPSLPPQQVSKEVRDWLREEFDRISLSGNTALEAIDTIRSLPAMFLAGDADDITLEPTDNKIVNYPSGGSLGEVPIDPDLLAGNIFIPISGVYRLTAYIYGLQPSVTQNESIRMLIDVNGVRAVIAAVDITSNQTDDRYLASTLSRLFLLDDVVSMYVNATGTMGPLEIQSTTLEMTFV